MQHSFVDLVDHTVFQVEFTNPNKFLFSCIVVTIEWIPGTCIFPDSTAQMSFDVLRACQNSSKLDGSVASKLILLHVPPNSDLIS